MIKSLDIENFGAYNSFVWRSALPNQEFKQLNIIFGRNYSGKTTLSRIFQSRESGVLPEKFDEPKFTFLDSSGARITESDIGEAEHDVRVYNSDFRRTHLRFLTDHDADGISAFSATLGADNNAIQTQIEDQERLLGEIEEQTGLRWDLAQKRKASFAAVAAKNRAQSSIDDSIRTKANKTFKHKSYFSSTYNTAKLTHDLAQAATKNWKVLPQDQSTQLQQATIETSIDSPPPQWTYTANFSLIDTPLVH